ncbi:MAG: ERCC4 domain-containing protein [Solobacterium sp.]|nr:ERCC4 domain-containing protein [Solobacterium sp.]
MIICDTRERKNQHILDYFEQRRIPYTVRKLDTGDYMDTANSSLTIDRKQNLDELCGNLFSPDKSRFWREVRRAKADKIRMIVLIEQGGQIKCLKDVPKWRSRYKKVTGYQLYNEICRCHIAYGVEFWFCDRRQTGKRIAEILMKGGDCVG